MCGSLCEIVGPPAGTQTDAKKGVNEVEGTRERVTKDVRTVPSSLANATPLPCSPTIPQRPTSLKPTVVLLEDRVADLTANEGVRQARIKGTKDRQKSSLGKGRRHVCRPQSCLYGHEAHCTF